MDLSSELIHAVLPLFMVGTLGATMVWVGFVEGISEAISLIVKIFSGTLSDYLGKRKFLTLIGYGLSAFTKPLFPMADSLNMVLVARFSDRVGKGIRGAPRDALVGDHAPAEIRGECFGLRQTLDTFGAFLAPVAAILLMIAFANDMRAVMWVATIPAVICIIILIIGVEDSKNLTKKKIGFPLSKENIKKLQKPFWMVVAAASLLTAARFSDAFLLIKAQSVGMSLSYVPLVLVVMNLVYTFSAYPMGIISDRFSRRKLLIIGIITLAFANFVLAFANDIYWVMVGTAIWGLHMGITQGLLATMVTDKSPEELRGTAYGIFNLACGVAMLFGSVIAGLLWDEFGAMATFLFGTTLAIISIPLLISNR
jgi:MFS family permease